MLPLATSKTHPPLTLSLNLDSKNEMEQSTLQVKKNPSKAVDESLSSERMVLHQERQVLNILLWSEVGVVPQLLWKHYGRVAIRARSQ